MLNVITKINHLLFLTKHREKFHAFMRYNHISGEMNPTVELDSITW